LLFIFIYINIKIKRSKPDTNLEEYLSLSENYSPKKEKPWVFKIENSKYIFNDVKSLLKVIDKFSKETYELERVNITKVISISSLACCYAAKSIFK